MRLDFRMLCLRRDMSTPAEHKPRMWRLVPNLDGGQLFSCFMGERTFLFLSFRRHFLTIAGIHRMDLQTYSMFEYQKDGIISLQTLSGTKEHDFMGIIRSQALRARPWLSVVAIPRFRFFSGTPTAMANCRSRNRPFVAVYSSFRSRHGFIASSTVVLFFPLPAIRWWLVRRKREKAGLCLACGYDMRGSTVKCPECGRTRNAKNVTSTFHLKPKQRRLIVHLHPKKGNQ